MKRPSRKATIIAVTCLLLASGLAIALGILEARIHNRAQINVLLQKRIPIIIAGAGNATAIPSWLSTLGPDGKWPDSEVDYTTGCPARPANWPAEAHWVRLTTMSAAWHGGLPGAEQYTGSPEVFDAVGKAMDWWFNNDFKVPACLDSGGTEACPCATPGLWNTNWFGSMILIPRLVGKTCLLLDSKLSKSRRANCIRATSRSFNKKNIHGLQSITGANTLDISSIGVDLGLISSNLGTVKSAYQRVHGELIVQTTVAADGIKSDGSFTQHRGLLYNGNYGKDYADDVLDLEVVAAGTKFAANSDTQRTFSSLIEGDQWSIFRNVATGKLQWDYSVIGRFISFPVADDDQVSSSIQINITKIHDLGEKWNSETLLDAANSLSQETPHANVGGKLGTRIFFNNDYAVQRGNGYVTTLKMFSQRTKNAECLNSQNPYGFHLSDGALYTYIRGDEYQDIFAAWNWNRIPGITSTSSTPLTCDQIQVSGVPSFIGGVSDDKAGVAAMKYTNPASRTLTWQKSWFFLEDDIQVVMVANITTQNGGDTNVYSVLDQRRHAGPIYVNGTQVNSTGVYSLPQSLWHGNVGYTFTPSAAFNLSLETGSKTGKWSTIGTSTQPPTTVDIFAAWLNHRNLSVPIAYTVFPATDLQTFMTKYNSTSIQVVQNDAHVSAIFDQKHNTAMAVFWDLAGGSTLFNLSTSSPFTLSASANIVVVYRLDAGKVTIADPSQKLTTATITMAVDGTVATPPHWSDRTIKTTVKLPEGGIAGSKMVWNL